MTEAGPGGASLGPDLGSVAERRGFVIGCAVVSSSGSSSETARRVETLAHLAVSVGANVAPGQDVVVTVYDISQADVARSVADAAYRAGARYVSVIYWDQHVKRSRLLYADPGSLGYMPGWWERHMDELIESRGAHILIWGDPDPGLLADIDPLRSSADNTPLGGAITRAHSGGEVNWTVIPAPTPGIAPAFARGR